jgi:hypothetical protein
MLLKNLLKYFKIITFLKKFKFSRIWSFFAPPVDEVYEDLDEEEKLRVEAMAKEAEAKKSAVPVHRVETTSTSAVEVEEKGSGSGFISKVLAFFGIYEDDHHEMVEEKPKDDGFKKLEQKPDPSLEKMLEMKEDFKQIAIIATATFKKLPKRKFELFKESNDFKVFKEILKKHNVIREK